MAKIMNKLTCFESIFMKKLLILLLVLGSTSAHALTVMNQTKNRNRAEQPIDIQTLSPEEKGQFCLLHGFKLLNCSDPYITGKKCPTDPAFVKECICKPEYDKACSETQGLRGVGIRCNGMYANCCTMSCKNPYATLASCQEQGLEEIHSERDYNDCGDVCYVCKDICVKGTPERMCPYGQECEPIEGLRSQQGQRCCNCKCPVGQKECMGVCIPQEECCPVCQDGYRCSEGLCLPQ